MEELQNKNKASMIRKALGHEVTWVIGIVATTYAIVQLVIFPIKALEFQMEDILGNHLKTIEDHQIISTTERKAQSEATQNNNDRLIRIELLLEQLIDADHIIK